MSHFIYDGTTLPYPKVNARPLSVPPNQGVAASDWNSACQALVDAQSALRASKWLGVELQGADPAPAGISNYWWVKAGGIVNLRAGAAALVVPALSPVVWVKGSLIVSNGVDDWAAIAPGVDGKVLKAKAAAAEGLEWGDATSIGAAGEKLITIAPAAGRATHDLAVAKVVGALAFDPAAHALTGCTRTLAFRVLLATSNGAKTVHARLWNMTDAEWVSAELSTTSLTTVKLEAALTEGAGAGEIDLAEKVYEVRIWIDAPGVGDTVELYGAELRVMNTIN